MTCGRCVFHKEEEVWDSNGFLSRIRFSCELGMGRVEEDGTCTRNDLRVKRLMEQVEATDASI